MSPVMNLDGLSFSKERANGLRQRQVGGTRLAVETEKA
jgi:hypothetical protein